MVLIIELMPQKDHVDPPARRDVLPVSGLGDIDRPLGDQFNHPRIVCFRLGKLLLEILPDDRLRLVGRGTPHKRAGNQKKE